MREIEKKRGTKTYKFITFAAVVVFIVFFSQRIIYPPSAERSVAIFQNVATIFFIFLLLRAVRCGLSGAPQIVYASCKRVALPLAMGAFVWGGSVPTFFISDDFGHLRTVANPLKTLVWDNLVKGQAHTFIRPVGFLSLALDYRLFHLWAPGFHLVCLLLHLAAVAGVFFFCRELGLGSNVCLFTALFFAVVPINAEAVVWIACRFDQIALAAMMWSLFAYTRFRRTGSNVFLILSLFLFLIAVFSKESAYVLPMILLLTEVVVLRPRRFLPVIAFFTLAAACFLERWWVFGGIGGYREASGVSSALQISANTFKGLFLRGPSEMLFGFNWAQPTARITFLIGGVVAAILFALLAFPLCKQSRFLWFALAWIVIAPIPAHSMVRVGADLVNSRELYFGTVGAALLVALLVDCVPHTQLRITLCVALTGVFAAGAWHNLLAWRYTAKLSQRLPAEIAKMYPNPEPGTDFVINNLPIAYRGIYFYQTGLDAAVQLAYGRTDLSARRRTAVPNRFAQKTVNLCWVRAEPKDSTLQQCQTYSTSALIR